MSFLAWYKRMLGGANGSARPYSLLQEAQGHLSAKEFDKARLVLLQAAKYMESVNDPAYVNYVLANLGDPGLWKNHAEEKDFFSEYLKQDPDNVAALVGRAGALWYSQNLKEALIDYGRALELDSNEISALSARGQVLAELARHDEALEDLDKALQLLRSTDAPDSDWAREMEAYTRNGRALALAGLGNYRGAFDEFEASIALCPDNAWAYFNRAQTFELCGNRERAVSDYRTSLTKDGPQLCAYKTQYAEKRLRELLGKKLSN